MKIMPLNIQVPDSFDVTSEAQAKTRQLLMEALEHYIVEHPEELGDEPAELQLGKTLLDAWNSHTLPATGTDG